MIDNGMHPFHRPWDSNENQAAVNERDRVLLLTKGCKSLEGGLYTVMYQRTATHEREIQNFLQLLPAPISDSESETDEEQ
jgi:hypothetical protein